MAFQDKADIYKHRMAGFAGLLRILDPGDWIIAWDLAEAYFHIMVHPDLARWFGIQFEGKFYHFRVLPFGWNLSMYFVNKLLAILTRYWRAQQGLQVWSHVDDFVCATHSEATAHKARKQIRWDLAATGVCEERSKAQGPTTSAIIYGFRVDTVGPQGCGLVSVDDKTQFQHILELMYQARGQRRPVRWVASVASKILSAQQAWAPAKAYLFDMFQGIDAWNRAPWEWSNNHKVTITADMAESAATIREAFSAHPGMPIWHKGRHLLVRWDAAGTGGWGGAVWDSPRVLQLVWEARRTGDKPPGDLPEPLARAGGPFSEAQQALHINDREALAAPMVMESFEDILAGNVIVPQGDSRTANAALTCFRGSTTAKLRNEVAKKLWAWAMRTGTTLLPVDYVNSRNNKAADEESRASDTSDWVVTDQAWDVIEAAYGPHTWDRFAAHTNTRCASFSARIRQPKCQWPDALTQPWVGETNYACPPESLILRVLRHIQQQPGCSATLVIPTYTAVWSPLLAQLEQSRTLLPPVDQAFQPGPSGHVEPWKVVGFDMPRTYAAIHVQAP